MKITKTGKTLETVAEELFKPSVPQRKVKAAFWASWKEGPSKGKPTISAAIEVTRCSTLENWAQEAGFREWFFNDQDHLQRLEYLFDMGLDMLEEIMETGDKAADKLKAFEYVAKLAQKLNKPETVIKYMDKGVQDMDIEELDAFIKKRLPEGSSEKEK